MGSKRRIALSTLLDRLPQAEVAGRATVRVTGIEIDSRAVEPGRLFVALHGAHTDGHRYVQEALARGASAVVVESAAGFEHTPAAALVVVPDSQRALSSLAAAFYGDPSQGLDVIGVTGTNGKTTATRMIAAILNGGAIPTGVIGTVGAEFAALRWELRNTTPLPPELHALLARMKEEGARAVAMEVSSHALALARVDDVRFSAAVLTNVTRDHLDFHESGQAYRAAKRRLFALAARCVLNLDDECGALWAAELQCAGRETITYGVAGNATLIPQSLEVDAEGSRFVLDGRRYELRMPGRFNVWNALAAIGAARFMGVSDDLAAQGLAALRRVPGRMERLEGLGIGVVVDYAHTPDALENALRALRETTAGHLMVVFGCGGDRDRGKRAEMGAVAARLADRIYLTSDNPRGEEPRVIVDDIAKGIPKGHPHEVELDRRRAIERAVAQAQPGDVVLVAGKGHENYQIVGDRVLEFDDVAVSRAALASPPAVQ
jgi:UDP-N-acetylmuramoyl-L-alanyl-D-glutamate--2,6-diaminopimelate ligase